MRDESGATTVAGASGTHHFDQSAPSADSGREQPRSNASIRTWIASALRRAAPYLAVVSALVLLIAMWLPWATMHVNVALRGYGSPEFAGEISVSGWNAVTMTIAWATAPNSYPLRMLGVLWSLFPLGGLVLGLLLQRQTRPSKPLLLLYGVWLAASAVTMLPLIVGLLTIVGPLSCWQTCTPMLVTARHPGLGIWLALGGLALGWLAFAVLMLLRRSPVGASRLAATPRYSPAHLAGAGIYTLGALFWGFGVLAVPWATSGCTGLHLSLNHFTRGACSGVDGWDVFTAGLASNGLLAFLLLEIVPTLGIFVVVTVWLPRLARETWVWAACWDLLVTLLFVVGVAGVRATIANPPVFTSAPQDPWVASYGVGVAAFGILLVWLGAILLAVVEIAHNRMVANRGLAAIHSA